MFEMFELPFMINAIIGTSLLIIMLSYFGIHVVKRCIVFIDLALAQIASFGVTLALLFEQDPIIFSIIFTLIGACIFFIIDIDNPKVPQEAIIGIFYVVASAACILVLSKATHSDQDVLYMLFGNVLAIKNEQIIMMLVVIVIMAFIHIFYRSKFIALSFEKNQNKKSFWNLLFYVTLAVAIAIAIRTAGVLLVFSYLIIPAVTALFITNKTLKMVIIAYLFGLIVNFMGIYESYVLDLPTGSTIIVNLGIGLLIIAVIMVINDKLKKPSVEDVENT